MHTFTQRLAIGSLLIVSSACTGALSGTLKPGVGADAGAADSAEPLDAFERDSATPIDSSTPRDSGEIDDSGSEPDLSAELDMGEPFDMGTPFDMGPRDMGPMDMGPRDMGPTDMGPRDMGPRDMGVMPGTRDPLHQPYASSSIWNMPIGSGAVYVPANMRAVPGGGSSWGLPFNEVEQIVLTPDAPLVSVRYSSVGWDGGNRCTPTSSTVLATIPMPDDFIIPNSSGNNSTVALAPDGHTLIQVQPTARCTAGGVATALVNFPDTDLYGDGATGAHGGSGLSALGGTLRLGELRPGQPPPRHVIKFTVYMRDAYRCTSSSNCYRWPALRGDSYAVGFYGTASGNPNVSNSAFRMGALLAIPTSVDIDSLGLESEPAQQMAWTLQNYGAYVVDDAYDPAFLIAVENSPDGAFVDQFEDDYGVPFNQNSDSSSGWARDIRRLLPILQIVDNNGPSSVGGGGTPLQPLAPEI